MLKNFVFIMGMMVASNTTIAEEIPFEIKRFVEEIDIIHDIAMQLDVRDDKDNMYWYLSLPERFIVAEKLTNIEKHTVLDTSQFLPYKDKNYNGIVMQARNNKGDIYTNLHVFNGHITDDDGTVLRNDIDRGLEMWMLGTAKRVEQKYIIAKTIPIVSFDQCKSLGNEIKHTDPRQCFLTTGDVLMEVKGGITDESLAVNSFDECLVNGQKLIKSFPRKCIAAGGRVFMEQTRKNISRKLKDYVWE